MAIFKFGKDPEILVLDHMMNNLIVQTGAQFNQSFLRFWLGKFIEEVKKHPKLLKSKFTVREFLMIKIISLEVAIKYHSNLTALEPQFAATRELYSQLLSFLKDLTQKSDKELSLFQPTLTKLYEHRFRFKVDTDVVLATCPILIVKMDVEFKAIQGGLLEPVLKLS